MAGSILSRVDLRRLLPARPWAAQPAPVRWGLPSLCAVCHGWGMARVCQTCLLRFAPTQPRCHRCALRVPEGQWLCGHCLVTPPPCHRCLAVADYQFPWAGLVSNYKFGGALDLARPLAAALAEVVRQAALATPPDLLLPVPLSAQRLRQRGYNQSWELARRLGPWLGLPAHADLLLRQRDTAHQLDLPPARRAANVRGAFRVPDAARPRLQGRQVALVDDVLTTGATTTEISHTLLQAGVAGVQVWVFARTLRPTTGQE